MAIELLGWIAALPNYRGRVWELRAGSASGRHRCPRDLGNSRVGRATARRLELGSGARVAITLTRMGALSHIALFTVVTGCGDNVVYPAGELFEGTACGGQLAAADGYVFFTCGNLGQDPDVIRVPAAGGGPDLFVDGSKSERTYSTGFTGDAELIAITAITTHGDEMLGCATDNSQNTPYFSVPDAGGRVSFLGQETPYTGGTIAPSHIVTNRAGTVYAIWPHLTSAEQPGPFQGIADAGDWAFGDVALDVGLFFVLAPYQSPDLSPSGAQVVMVDAGVTTRLALLPSRAFSRIEVDDQNVFVAGTSGIVRIARADGSVTALGVMRVFDLVDVGRVAYTLEQPGSIVRYESGATTSTPVDIGEEVVGGSLASDGQELFYLAWGSSGRVVIRKLGL
jgi:hypothetical protein